MTHAPAPQPQMQQLEPASRRARDVLRNTIRDAEGLFSSGQIYAKMAKLSLANEPPTRARQIAIQHIYENGCSPESLATLRPAHVQLVWRMAREHLESLHIVEADQCMDVTCIADIPLPPPPPQDLLNQLENAQDEDVLFYDAHQDHQLTQFIDFHKAIASRLGLTYDPHFGFYLEQLFDPRLTRLVWPSPQEIFSYEYALIRKTAEHISTKSLLGLEDWLAEAFGFNISEAFTVRQMALGYLSDFGALDVDEARGLVLMRLERFFEQSTRELDNASTFRALKLQAQILGLGKQQPATDREDFLSLAASLTVEDETDPEPSSPTPALEHSTDDA